MTEAAAEGVAQKEVAGRVAVYWEVVAQAVGSRGVVTVVVVAREVVANSQKGELEGEVGLGLQGQLSGTNCTSH